MTRDERLQMNPGSRRYRKQVASTERELAESLDEEAWSKILNPITSALLTFARGELPAEVPFPVDGDARFREPFLNVQRRFASDLAHQGTEPVDRVFDRKLAQHVALQLPAEPKTWFKIAGVFYHTLDWASFPDSVPISAIQHVQADLIRIELRLEDCFQTPGLRGKALLNSLNSLDQLRAEEKGEWNSIMRLRCYADQCMLNETLTLQARLLSRLSSCDWLAWVLQLPHPSIIAMAFDDVSDLDFIGSIIRENASVVDKDTRRLVLILSVLRALELWTKITTELSKVVERTHGVESVEQEAYRRMQSEWTSTELPARASSVASLLGSSAQGLDVARLFFTHLSVFEGFAVIEIPAKALFRGALINEFTNRNIDCAGTGCALNPSSTSLLAGALLANRILSPQNFDVVFSAYGVWLQTSKSIWHEQLNGESDALVRGLATVLPQVNNPIARAIAMIASVRKPPQGWSFNYSQWLSSLPAVTHAIMVTALAAECAFQNEGASLKSDDLMSLALSELNSLLREAPTDLQLSQIASPIAYVWACAAHAYRGSQDSVTRALAMIDDAELIILAASNFRNNGGVLSLDTKRFIRETFEAQRPVMDLQHQISAERLSTLTNKVDEICALPLM